MFNDMSELKNRDEYDGFFANKGTLIDEDEVNELVMMGEDETIEWCTLCNMYTVKSDSNPYGTCQCS